MTVNLILTAFTQLASVSLIGRQFSYKIASRETTSGARIGNGFFTF